MIFVETEKTGEKSRKRWNLVVWNRCDHLRPDNGCEIYEDRPGVCRDYKSDTCEYDSPWVFEKSFETPESVRIYGEKHLAEAKAARARSRSEKAKAIEKNNR